MVRTIMLGAAVAAALCGCASKSSEISASYVSPVQFQSYTCQQLAMEASAISQRAAIVSGAQDAKRSNDAVATGVAVVVFWPAAFLVGGDGPQAAELANLKGQMVAIEQAANMKRCAVQSEAEPPQTEGMETMAKVKTSTDNAGAKAHPDGKLITVCVEYGFTMGAAKVAYGIDPTDAEIAAPIDIEKISEGDRLLVKAASMEATTLDGLAAKAKTLQAARTLMAGSAFDSSTEGALLASLAADVCRFHEAAGGGRLGAETCKPFASAAQ